MTGNTMRLTAAIIAATAALTAAGPASAGTGCNGVVNILVWGCAPWDNNNGAQFPYFKKQTIVRNAPKGSQVQIKDGAAMVNIGGQWFPVAGGTAGIVAAGGGNIVAAGGGNIVNAGGLNLKVIQQN